MRLGRLDIQISNMGRKYITMGCVIVLAICLVVSFVDGYYCCPLVSAVHGLIEFVICRRLYGVLVSVHSVLKNKSPT